MKQNELTKTFMMIFVGILYKPHNLTPPPPYVQIIWDATQKKYVAFHLNENYIHVLLNDILCIIIVYPCIIKLDPSALEKNVCFITFTFFIMQTNR